MKKFIFPLLCVIAFNSIVFSQVIPDDRRIIWSPGIPGGIPEISGPIANAVIQLSFNCNERHRA